MVNKSRKEKKKDDGLTDRSVYGPPGDYVLQMSNLSQILNQGYHLTVDLHLQQGSDLIQSRKSSQEI